MEVDLNTLNNIGPSNEEEESVHAKLLPQHSQPKSTYMEDVSSLFVEDEMNFDEELRNKGKVEKVSLIIKVSCIAPLVREKVRPLPSYQVRHIQDCFSSIEVEDAKGQLYDNLVHPCY